MIETTTAEKNHFRIALLRILDRIYEKKSDPGKQR